VTDEQTREPSSATGAAALRAGWSHRHRDVSGGWLRPIVLTGVAALVAGAFSMGTGEYVSVTNQNDLVLAEVELERRMLAQFPAAEEAELADSFREGVTYGVGTLIGSTVR
jgi:vacuolar iron transporter family protein